MTKDELLQLRITELEGLQGTVESVEGGGNKIVYRRISELTAEIARLRNEIAIDSGEAVLRTSAKGGGSRWLR